MASRKKDDETIKLAYEFLITDYKLFADNLWKTFDRVWDIYKFYITLISGLGGILLGLLTLGITWNMLYPLPSAFALIIFILGVSLYIQLINIDIAFKKNYARMNLARQKISEIAVLDKYLSDVKDLKAEWVYWDPSYSLKGLLRRAVRGAGVKTQVTIINSLIGISSIISFLYTNISLSISLWIGICVSGYFFLILFHGVVALVKAKVEE